VGLYQTTYEASLSERDQFWTDEAKNLDWKALFTQVLEVSRPPFAKWFVGGLTNICYNSVDRHLKSRATQAALIYVSTETGDERTINYQDLYNEVNTCASMLVERGVEKGDRVLIYMPMIPEAAYMMLACLRIGAIHSVVFGGFAAHALSTRIDDAKPKLIVTADAGLRAGKAIHYKPLLDEAIQISASKPESVILFNRGIDKKLSLQVGRDFDYHELHKKHSGQLVDVEWVESSHPSYILYTSGTTGRPKGVQRDTGGYAVALISSLRKIYDCQPGDTMLTTSDIGWVVGHSYIVYGPLLNGMTSLFYEGTPIRPDGGIWWSLVEKYKVKTMFSSPTAVRLLKKQDPKFLKQYNLSSLRSLFLAGEPLDESTARWMSEGIGVPVVDNYWQTETGWPILSCPLGIEKTKLKNGSPSFPMFGYKTQILNEETFEQVGANEKGILMIEPPLPPGCLSTVWNDDERFLKYFSSVPGKALYNTYDWAICDSEGYYFILGRSDDVINVAGHRLGTREIEEAVSTHKNVAEAAVVGVADALKGQVPYAFVVLKETSFLQDEARAQVEREEIMACVDHEIGAIGRPSKVYFVNLLPKTRSGKLLRRAIQAICEGKDPGDLPTIEDPVALEQIRTVVNKN
jgi:propionyl-CoA synthetase